METLLVKLDEDLPHSLKRVVNDHGYVARTVVDQGWGGRKDAELWPDVVAAGEVLITADKEFGDIRRFPPGSHPGIVLLRAEPESAATYHALLVQVMERLTVEQIRGNVTVSTKAGVRVRRAL